MTINYILISIIFLALLLNLYIYNLKNIIHINNHKCLKINFKKFIKKNNLSFNFNFNKVIDFLTFAGFEELYILLKSNDNDNCLSNDYVTFVFINKNYTLYLELTFFKNKLLIINTINQFYDLSINIISSSENILSIKSDFISYDILKPNFNFDDDNIDYNLIIDYLNVIINKHINKTKIIHQNGLAPYYVNAKHYESCKNYLCEFVKFN